MNTQTRLAWITALAALTVPAPAAFHVMQIEQVIGSLNGNTNAQAIQLRLRLAGQNQVQFCSLWAADASGQNRVLLLNIASAVSNSATGARILLTTSAFTSTMNMGMGGPAFSPDFALANAIPASYLTAGRLTFEDDGGSVASPGTIYWSVAWGGSNYTGPHTGNTQNDLDGNFGPAFGSPLPFGLGQGIVFTGAAADPSTTNLANYALTANQATVTKNNGTSFTVVPEPGSIMALGGLAFCALIFYRRRVEAV